MTSSGTAILHTCLSISIMLLSSWACWNCLRMVNVGFIPDSSLDISSRPFWTAGGNAGRNRTQGIKTNSCTRTQWARVQRPKDYCSLLCRDINALKLESALTPTLTHPHHTYSLQTLPGDRPPSPAQTAYQIPRPKLTLLRNSLIIAILEPTPIPWAMC